MLSLMRKHAKSWVINVLIAAIAIVFIFWGAGSFREQDFNKVATVNGEPISVAAYQETYRRLIERLESQFKGMLNDELLQAMDLKGQALNQLIDEKIIFQQAQAMGLDVALEELQRQIAQTDMFQVDGRFDPKRYRDMLGRFGYTPEMYEQLVLQDQVNRYVVRLISGLAMVSETEALNHFHLANDQVDLDFILFSPDKFEDALSPTDEDITAYFEKNRETYRIPEMAKVAFVAFRPEELIEEARVSDDEAADYYEINLDEYREPEQVKARHILLRVDPDASAEEEGEVRQRAEDVLAKARAEGQDFAALATEFSEGPTAPKGGDLGWFARDQMVEAFAEAAFAMEKDEISSPVKTQFGYHIIKVEDRQSARIKPLDDVKEEILTKLKKEKATLLALDRAEEAYDEVSLSRDLDALAENYKITPVVTDFFSARDTLVEVGMDPKFNQVALSLNPGEIGPLLDLDDGHYIIKLLEKKESRLPELKDVVEDVRADVLAEQAMAKAREEAEAFLKQAGQDDGWDQAVADMELDVRKTGPFTRRVAIPDIGRNPEITAAAFNLDKVGQVANKPFQNENGYYVIRLREHLPASQDAFEAEKQQLMAELEQAKGGLYFQEWLEAVKAGSEIKIEKGVI
jgi:peptidyl-prolyl cis-trans isomerase D